ncbi:MAG: thiamine pyrophosphate-requiring protein [Rhodobacteraceae bacterium]|nr:thiamine pyrophosphate-requiring protein [Paracoccaceae bacterium]
MTDRTAGAALFIKLKALGVDWVFANSGTDFPPIIEGLIAERRLGTELPRVATVPHEHVAVGMAHGYTLMSGHAQAVMMHTNVGLANGATGAINAACDQIPMILMSGRTPVTEGGRFGARTVPIGWGQEMFDQAALIREACKWDYELRFPDQVAPVLDRAWSIANSTPSGPVYLSLPREVLCEPCPSDNLADPSRMTPALTAPDPSALAAAAKTLAGARMPLIIAQRGTGSENAFRALSAFVERHAIPLSHYWANRIALPLSSPMHVGWQADSLIRSADVILVLDALAPWWPDRVNPHPEATVIHLGPDPLFARSSPMRTFQADIALAGETAPTLQTLIDAVDALPCDRTLISERRESIETLAARERRSQRNRARSGCRSPMTKDWVSHCLATHIKRNETSVFHELGCPLPSLQPDDRLGYFQEPHSGGLGWCLPAAMGAKLAAPDRLVFATMGDGSYMFANPVACHQLCESLEIPIITLVLNNGEWGAVRNSVEGLYPDGLAVKANQVPLTSLRPSPNFAQIAAASRAHSETITDGADLPAALERSVTVALQEKRQVLLDIAIE